MLFSHNSYHHSHFFTAIDEISGKYHNTYYNASKYFDLQLINDSLLIENSKLRTEISKLKKTYPERQNYDTNINYGFIYKPAHIINNSIDKRNNFLTLDIGSNSNVKQHMGVISYDGVVGLIKRVSPNFSYCISILNSDFKVNAKIKELNEIGSITWDGNSIYHVVLTDIPNNVKVKKGQHVVVGPYSDFFPEDYPIGIIENFNFVQGGNFYSIKVRLQADIKNSKMIYVINKVLFDEQLNIENIEDSE
jgi:rod shape-determining protein MreC